MANAKKMMFRTSKGIAMYPWLNKADFQFDSNGQFKVNLRMPEADAKNLMDEVKKAADEAFGAKLRANAVEKDADTGELVLVTKSKCRPKFADSRVS